MESPAGSYARSRQPTALPTVRFSPATTVSFTAAVNTWPHGADVAASTAGGHFGVNPLEVVPTLADTLTTSGSLARYFD
jgi:hypothetical protein